ncbi:MAG TPA: OsmC family protein [Gemmataceae bacterium]|nr:OsmC family protein [Gemmataceae bacterium]
METKRTSRTFRYRASTIWSSARRGLLQAAEKPAIIVGSPPEFKGEPNIWAPEELLVGSVNTCMMLTFLSLAESRGLTPAEYASEAEGLLEDIGGKYSFTEITVRPLISVKSEAAVEPTRKIMESAERHCFISNSVKAKVNVVVRLVVAPSPA